MTPQLVALNEGPNLLLDKPILLVGRHQECDVQIPSRKISRKHCCISQVSDHLVVKDLYSTNGIRINGQRVNEGALHDGDELTIGNLRYRVEWQADASRAEDDVVVAVHSDPRPAVRAEDLQSSDRPVLLSEESNLPPIPAGRPLVLPVDTRRAESESHH